MVTIVTLRSSLSILLLVAALCTAACPSAPTTPPPGEAERRALTANLVDGFLAPRLTDFAAKAAALREASDALAATNGAGTAERGDAQAAWRAAMGVWQELEMMHLGPAGVPSSFVGGQGLRERIYAWPLVNLCAVDQQVLLGEFSAEGWAELRLPNVIGLAAVEYLLFVDGDGNACPESAGMNTSGSWAALGSDELRTRRARYAAVVGSDVDAKAAELRDAWLLDGGFAQALRAAGTEGSPFATAQQALDEVYAALFAIELLTKDKKLGIPAGLHVDCPAESCPEKAESPFSRTSKENIGANLEAVRSVFLGLDAAGGNDTGFDNLLVDQGQAQLATDMAAALDNAIAAVGSFSGTLEDALAAEPARARALYDVVKVFTDEFKGPFPSALGLRVPAEGAGDND